jgi:hypothetical protein
VIGLALHAGSALCIYAKHAELRGRFGRLGAAQAMTDIALKNYRNALSVAPLPTPEQTRQFADYVSSAHSWYKHLPLSPPGAPFMFYLDPNAGRRLVQGKNREWEYQDLPQGEDFFHYSQMPTVEYRQQFGIWNYSTDAGTRFIVRGEDGTEKLDTSRTDVEIPQPLMEVGTVHLTGFVYPVGGLKTAFLLWPPRFSAEETADPDSWAARCQRLVTDVEACRQAIRALDTSSIPGGSLNASEIDEVVYLRLGTRVHDIHEQRRKFELDLMVNAMDRVLEMLAGKLQIPDVPL